MDLPFAGLHQLCAPMLDRLERLPVPQSDALRTAFGVSVGATPDRFLIGLAVLSLLSEIAQERPLVCLIDDQQWLDRASVQVLVFAARRLAADPVGLVFATRSELTGLPELMVSGLRAADARALLDSVLTGPFDPGIRDQIVAETGGNPLALLELPRGLTPAELAGGFGLPGALQLEGSIEGSFRARMSALPDKTRLLMLVAAAEPSGDPGLLWMAAARLGIGSDAATPATDADLAELGNRIRFRHPIVRSAAYQTASAHDRQRVHRVLAEVTDAQTDPDRRAWHRAQAAPGPDEDVAKELERSAGRAQARGGLAAAAAFLQRAAMLTLDPSHRAARALGAAQAEIRAGAFDAALDLLATAEVGPLSDLQQAHLDLARAELAYVTNRGNDAPPLLLKAAARLESVDSDLSRATYLQALTAAIFAGRLAGEGGSVPEVARAARAAPAPAHAPRAPDLLLDGTVALSVDGFPKGAPILRRALAAFGTGMSAEEELHWLWLASITALRVWDDDRWDALSARHVELARGSGALSELPLALTSRAYILLFAGDLAGAASVVDEGQTVQEATGGSLAAYGPMGLAAMRGDEARALALIEATKEDASRRGEGVGITLADWAHALLANGLGRYQDALAAAERATSYRDDPGDLVWTTVELVEAAARMGITETATNAHRELAVMTTASGTQWALGVEARSHALVSDGESAERLYLESIARLGRTRIRTDLARAHLLYGEWLRRERRRIDARENLHTAHRMFEAMGLEGFAERARRELRATGETVHKRADPAKYVELTPQEAQIARLARGGLSNPEIGTRLFISAHTVQYHLRKVFAKLQIKSRSQLDRAFPDGRPT
jgi:DNA-binding CsgD family transcriptional regulator